MHLPEALLSEAVRLFERPCAPMQERWRISADGRFLTLALADEPESDEIADALYIQRELGEELLDYFELEAPGQLERRADELSLRLERAVCAA